MLPLNDPGQTKKVLRMLFSSRMRFYCVRLWLYPKHFLFFNYFVFGPGGPSFFSLSLSPPADFPPKKQTNEQAKKA